MKKYEAVFIFKPDLEDAERNTVFDRIKGIIEENGKIEEVDEWGKRKLAYEINYIREGYYIIVNFEARPEIIHEIERRARISDPIIRYMVINKEEK